MPIQASAQQIINWTSPSLKKKNTRSLYSMPGASPGQGWAHLQAEAMGACGRRSGVGVCGDGRGAWARANQGDPRQPTCVVLGPGKSGGLQAQRFNCNEHSSGIFEGAIRGEGVCNTPLIARLHTARPWFLPANNLKTLTLAGNSRV